MAAVHPILQRLDAQQLGLLVEHQGELRFASDRQGFVPLRFACFHHPTLLDGADVAVPTVGLAAAYLLILAKAGRVYARTMTQAAHAALSDEGIEHSAAQIVKKLPQKLDETAGLDARAAQSVSAQAFVEDLRRYTQQ